MDLNNVLAKASGIMGGMSSLFGGGDGDDKKPKKPFSFEDELKSSYKKPLKYDNNRPVNEVVFSAAQKGKIDPSELLTSAWVEGLNRAVANPDNVSEAYENFAAKDPSIRKFPVDGFYNYGLDTVGDNYEGLKKYLPEGFDKRMKIYDALNEKGQKVKTAAFMNNEDALVVKSAFMNMEKDNIAKYAKSKGIDLDEKAKRYFTMASFNGGPGRGRQMVDEYLKSSDREHFIDKGLTSLGAIHKNISPRMKMIDFAKTLFSGQSILPSPQKIVTQ